MIIEIKNDIGREYVELSNATNVPDELYTNKYKNIDLIHLVNCSFSDKKLRKIPDNFKNILFVYNTSFSSNILSHSHESIVFVRSNIKILNFKDMPKSLDSISIHMCYNLKTVNFENNTKNLEYLAIENNENLEDIINLNAPNLEKFIAEKNPRWNKFTFKSLGKIKSLNIEESNLSKLEGPLPESLEEIKLIQGNFSSWPNFSNTKAVYIDMSNKAMGGSMSVFNTPEDTNNSLKKLPDMKKYFPSTLKILALNHQRYSDDNHVMTLPKIVYPNLELLSMKNTSIKIPKGISGTIKRLIIRNGAIRDINPKDFNLDIQYIEAWGNISTEKLLNKYKDTNTRFKQVGMFGPFSIKPYCITPDIKQPILIATDDPLEYDRDEHESNELMNDILSYMRENKWKLPKKYYLYQDLVAAPSVKELKEIIKYGLYPHIREKAQDMLEIYQKTKSKKNIKTNKKIIKIRESMPKKMQKCLTKL